MTTRGPLRQPDSVRGLKEGVEVPRPEAIEAPTWLKKRAREVFAKLVAEAIDGGVPTKACDAHIFAMAAQCTVDYQTARDAMARARIGRDLEKFYDVIGATPKARLRMGLKGKPAAQSKTAKLLAMVKAGTPEADQTA